MTKHAVTLLGMVLGFGVAVQSHAAWMLVEGSLGSDPSNQGNAVEGWIEGIKMEDVGDWIDDGDLDDDTFGGLLNLNPGTNTVTFHYGNGGETPGTIAYMCDGNDCDTFDFASVENPLGGTGLSTKAISNYRAFGTSVPEPGTLAVVGAGLVAGLALLRRRRIRT